MGTDEKVGERHERYRCIGLRNPPLSIFTVCRGADVGSSSGHIENIDAPAAYSIGRSRRVCVANTNLSQAHRIDGGTLTGSFLSDRFHTFPTSSGILKISNCPGIEFGIWQSPLAPLFQRGENASLRKREDGGIFNGAVYSISADRESVSMVRSLLQRPEKY